MTSRRRPRIKPPKEHPAKCQNPNLSAPSFKLLLRRSPIDSDEPLASPRTWIRSVRPPSLSPFLVCFRVPRRREKVGAQCRRRRTAPLPFLSSIVEQRRVFGRGDE